MSGHFRSLDFDTALGNTCSSQKKYTGSEIYILERLLESTAIDTLFERGNVEVTLTKKGHFHIFVISIWSRHSKSYIYESV